MSGPWKLYEIETFQEGGTRRLPVAIALSKAPPQDRNRLIAVRKILLLPTDEWPNPRRAEVQRVEDGIFVLKAKPSQWRISQ